MFKWLRKFSQTTRAIVQFYMKQPVWTPNDFHKMAEEGYQKNAYVYACVRLVSMSCAGIPWLLYQTRRGTKGLDLLQIHSKRRHTKVKSLQRKSMLEELERHPLLELLSRPNPYMSQSKFIENLVGFLLLSGNLYVERVGPSNGSPKELWCLRPDRMKVIVGNSVQPIQGYKYTVGSQSITLDPDIVLHLKMFNPINDFYGQPPIQAIARSIDQNNESKKWNVALLQNFARPPGAMVTDKNLDDNQFNRLKTQLREEYMGAQNAGIPMLLEGGVDWKSMALNPVDMDWLEGQKLSAREIAIGFGVPPELIGDSENKTHSNYKEARSALYMETVLPLMDSIRDELNVWLVPLFGDNLYLDYDIDSIEALQEDRNETWDRVLKAVEKGLISRNEGREVLGYDRVDVPELDAFSSTATEIFLGLDEDEFEDQTPINVGE